MHRSFFSLILLQADVLVRPGIIYGAISVISVLILMLLACILVILLWKGHSERRRKALQAPFQEWLVEVILDETDAPHPGFVVPERIQVLLQRDLARQQLLEELKQLKSTLSGRPGENLRKLYIQLGLLADSVGSLRSRKWNLIAKGIQELAVMEQQELAEEVLPFTNHPHPVVRMEAQIAMATLQQNKRLQFFAKLKYPLSEWHQIKLLQLLANQQLPDKEMIGSWLRSPNVTVVQFTLKLIGEQHALLFLDEVIACLGHPNEAVRYQAITCLGQIPSELSAKALSEFFYLEPQKKLKMAILSGFAKTATANDLPFLLMLQQAPDVDIALAAEKTLLHLQVQATA